MEQQQMDLLALLQQMQQGTQANIQAARAPMSRISKDQGGQRGTPGLDQWYKNNPGAGADRPNPQYGRVGEDVLVQKAQPMQAAPQQQAPAQGGGLGSWLMGLIGGGQQPQQQAQEGPRINSLTGLPIGTLAGDPAYNAMLQGQVQGPSQPQQQTPMAPSGGPPQDPGLDYLRNIADAGQAAKSFQAANPPQGQPQMPSQVAPYQDDFSQTVRRNLEAVLPYSAMQSQMPKNFAAVNPPSLNTPEGFNGFPQGPPSVDEVRAQYWPESAGELPYGEGFSKLLEAQPQEAPTMSVDEVRAQYWPESAGELPYGEGFSKLLEAGKPKPKPQERPYMQPTGGDFMGNVKRKPIERTDNFVSMGDIGQSIVSPFTSAKARFEKENVVAGGKTPLMPFLKAGYSGLMGMQRTPLRAIKSIIK